MPNVRALLEREQEKRTLRCFAAQSNEAWEAICLDLDIAAQGVSFEDADQNLRCAIRMYFERVDTLPAEERKKFLYRRVPLITRIQFAIEAALSSLAIRTRQEHQQYYKIPFPL
jgi:hypothetical protein